jgi:hypothetical protein
LILIFLSLHLLTCVYIVSIPLPPPRSPLFFCTETWEALATEFSLAQSASTTEVCSLSPENPVSYQYSLPIIPGD